jgi:DNA-binding response OmpR family regulator
MPEVEEPRPYPGVDVMNARLDQILLRLGYATEEQIQQALRRQKTHGGRLGSHLLYFKALTEGQLAEALSIQHDLPYFDPTKHEVSMDVAGKFPATLARKHQAVPISCDMIADSVCVVVADPEDTHPIAAVRKTFAFANVSRLIAPETVVAALIDRVHRTSGSNPDHGSAIELPELFGPGGAETGGPGDSPLASNENRGHVLLVSKAAFLRNFLRPIFEREGYDLHVVWDRTDLELSLKTIPFEHILVAEEAEGEFAAWIRSTGVPLPRAETSAFSAVSDALLQNPVPYPKMIRSLFRALQIIAETRCSHGNAATPPYDLICRDIERLGRSLGLKRLVVDGLQIASYLLVPRLRAKSSSTHGEVARVSFIDLDGTIDRARSLRFPWDVSSVFAPFADLLSGSRSFDSLGPVDAETQRAAQVLALVWFRHTSFETLADAPDDDLSRSKNRIRDLAGRLADSETIECYVRIIERAGEETDAGRRRQLFVVGHFDGIADQFATRLRHAGYNPVRIDDLREARSMCSRVLPAAILVHFESYPKEIIECRKSLKLDAPVFLYAITQDNNPSRTLTLFDAGFDDVFAPPFDFDVIAARIAKSIRGVVRAEPSNLRSGGFRASLKAFAFIDLVQALAQSRKSVRITLTHDGGEQARVFMREGRLVHARCARLSGVGAVYRVIAWGEHGAFTVEPEGKFPKDNVAESVEAVLMEGCRLLDESMA